MGSVRGLAAIVVCQSTDAEFFGVWRLQLTWWLRGPCTTANSMPQITTRARLLLARAPRLRFANCSAVRARVHSFLEGVACQRSQFAFARPSFFACSRSLARCRPRDSVAARDQGMLALARRGALAAAQDVGRRWQHQEAVQAAFAACQDTVRTNDHDTYLWARALPSEVRAPVMMLRALDVETRMIGTLITQGGAPLKEMRFQWWQDSVNAAFAGKRIDHPVLVALSYTLDVQPLSLYRLQRLISARKADQVARAPLQTLKDAEDLAESTQSQLLYLQLEAAGVKSADADHAASHLGKAVGLVNMLRGTLQYLQRGVSYLPAEECGEEGIAARDLVEGNAVGSEGCRNVVHRMASAAKGHLDTHADLHGRPEAVPREARRLFLSAVACGLYLDALEKCNFNLLDQRLARGGYSPLWYVLQLKLAQMRV